jgi:hypothetical protein
MTDGNAYSKAHHTGKPLKVSGAATLYQSTRENVPFDETKFNEIFKEIVRSSAIYGGKISKRSVKHKRIKRRTVKCKRIKRRTVVKCIKKSVSQLNT